MMPGGYKVSIRTRHFCRVMPRRIRGVVANPRVSIRTRHFCRVMPHRRRPARAQAGVSIRTRHFCRVMLDDFAMWCEQALFQSAPGISAG